MNLSNDYRLVTKHRLTFPTFVYFLSRCVHRTKTTVHSQSYLIIQGSLLWLTFSSALSLKVGCLCSNLSKKADGHCFHVLAAPVDHCSALEKTVDVLYPISTASTSLLFFLRIRAIFNRNKYLVAFFFFLWISVLAGGLTIVTAVTATNVGPTSYCLNASLKPYASAAPITSAVHDTLVFFAISWRLLSNSHVDVPFETQLKAFITGEYLPSFSRALLKDGQLYYLYVSFFDVS